MFKNKVINKELYNKPENIENIYTNYNVLEKKNNNYLSNSHLQIYYNLYKIYEKFGDTFEKKYDYIILTRSDFLYLFQFPNILELNNNNIFWCYDGHEYDGINTCLICVPSIFIKSYLSSFYNYLQNVNNVNILNNLDLNVEQYTKFIFDDKKWKIGKIQNNAFITADDNNTRTTWGTINYSDKYKVYYKYEEQLNNAYNALNDYNSNKKWTNDNVNNIEYILLK